MTPLLEKTDHMLASWGAQLGLSRGAATQGKSGDSPVASQPEALARGDKPELEASNSVTSAVVPILEKTDEYLASWGITRSVSNAKSEGEGVLQVSCLIDLYFVTRLLRQCRMHKSVHLSPSWTCTALSQLVQEHQMLFSRLHRY